MYRSAKVAPLTLKLIELSFTTTEKASLLIALCDRFMLNEY